jgi:hypothetical protein
MTEAFLDTNVLVAAFVPSRMRPINWCGPSAWANWRPNISVALALEYEEVLKRKGVLPSGLTEAAIDRFLDYLLARRRRPSNFEMRMRGSRSWWPI